MWQGRDWQGVAGQLCSTGRKQRWGAHSAVAMSPGSSGAGLAAPTFPLSNRGRGCSGRPAPFLFDSETKHDLHNFLKREPNSRSESVCQASAAPRITPGVWTFRSQCRCPVEARGRGARVLPRPAFFCLKGRDSSVKLRHHDKACVLRLSVTLSPQKGAFSPNTENRHRPWRHRGHHGRWARLTGGDTVSRTLA